MTRFREHRLGPTKCIRRKMNGDSEQQNIWKELILFFRRFSLVMSKERQKKKAINTDKLAKQQGLDRGSIRRPHIWDRLISFEYITNNILNSQQTHHISITKKCLLVFFFRKIITVCCEDHNEHVCAYRTEKNVEVYISKQVVHARATAIWRAQNPKTVYIFADTGWISGGQSICSPVTTRRKL